MRIVMATVIGVTAASAGFGAGLVGTIAVSPWTGAAVPAINMGWAVGVMAMMSSFVLAVRRLKPVRIKSQE
jgi:hypothetical protein